MREKRILVIAAHPDDEVLGCGGTMAKLSKENEVSCLILGTGYASRTDGKTDTTEEVNALQIMAQEANRILGYDFLYMENLPDNRFDSVDLLDIVKIIEEYKERRRPDIIFTHQANCLNIDHQRTFRAVLTATRPQPGEVTTELYSFEIPSSSEWNFPSPFIPDTFVDITNTLDKKLAALKAYKDEMRDFPHPRSLENVRLLSHLRGSQVGFYSAEAFQTIRRKLA